MFETKECFFFSTVMSLLSLMILLHKFPKYQNCYFKYLQFKHIHTPQKFFDFFWQSFWTLDCRVARRVFLQCFFFQQRGVSQIGIIMMLHYSTHIPLSIFSFLLFSAAYYYRPRVYVREKENEFCSRKLLLQCLSKMTSTTYTVTDVVNIYLLC